MNRMLLSICAVSALLFAASFSTAPTSMAMDDMGILIKDRCVSCHGLAKTCTNLGKDRVWWDATLARMVKRGADIEPSQVEPIGAYLTAPTEAFLKACGR